MWRRFLIQKSPQHEKSGSDSSKLKISLIGFPLNIHFISFMVQYTLLFSIFIGYPNLNLGRYATSILGNIDFLCFHVVVDLCSIWNHSYKVNFGGVLFDFTKYQKLVCKIRGRKFRYRSTQNLGEYIQVRIQNDVGVSVHCVCRCHTTTGP